MSRYSKKKNVLPIVPPVTHEPEGQPDVLDLPDDQAALSGLDDIPDPAPDPAQGQDNNASVEAEACAPAQPAPSPPPQEAAPGQMPPDMPPKPAPSLFSATEAFRRELLPEDLPYANEVEAALARQPKKSARWLSLAVGLFFVLMIFWAGFATVDEVTHAEGQVVASQRTQAIQNLEGGILREILVSEGQIVEKGDILARLDNEMAESSYRDAINKAMDHQAAIIRLEAELNGAEPVFPENLAEWLHEITRQNVTSDLSAQASQLILDQKTAYLARTQQREAELLILQSQYEQKLHDVEEQSARKRQLDKSLALAIEQRNIATPLMERHNFSRVEYLGLQQKVVSLQGDIETLASSIPKAQAAAQEAEQRIVFRRAELDSAITEEINKRRQELASLRETLSAGSDRVTRTELRSPVRGTVKQIALSTIGGVVKPGESIMEIVPLDDTLLIEARVRPADVAFLLPGQRAMVKISAYDFSIYGGLEGHLEQISADTIEDKRGDFYYLVKVRTNETEIVYRNTRLPIIPGMMATVDIMIGKKTVLNYILKPIFKARQNALRER